MARKLKSDKLLFIATLLLVCTGIVMVYSASAVMAMEKFQTPYLFLGKQLAWALMGLAVLAFIWYNLQFVQHQGRYLFPALIPVATAFALGWSFILSRRENIARWLWLVVLTGLFAFNTYALLRVILPAMQA